MYSRYIHVKQEYTNAGPLTPQQFNPVNVCMCGCFGDDELGVRSLFLSFAFVLSFHSPLGAHLPPLN